MLKCPGCDVKIEKVDCYGSAAMTFTVTDDGVILDCIDTRLYPDDMPEYECHYCGADLNGLIKERR